MVYPRPVHSDLAPIDPTGSVRQSKVLHWHPHRSTVPAQASKAEGLPQRRKRHHMVDVQPDANHFANRVVMVRRHLRKHLPP